MRTKRGFSLLELLLAVTIFSIIAVVLIASFTAGIRIMRRSEEAMRRHQSLRLAMDEISLDLRNALLAPLPAAERQTVAETEGGQEPVYYFTGTRDGFEFVTLKERYEEGGSVIEVCRAEYYFDEGNPAALMRSIMPLSSGPAAGGTNEDEILLSGIIKGMEVTYCYEPLDEDGPPEWYDYWEMEEAIPAGVKIDFDLVGLGPLSQFKKTVLTEVGVLGSLEDEGAP